MMSKRLFYGFFFLIALATLSYYIGGVRATTKFLGFFAIYFAIFYSIYWVIKSIIKSEPITPYAFFVIYTYKLSVTLSILILCMGGFAYYQNNINPASLPLYTLSNGEKTLQFQAMSHIAQENFYKKVQISIAEAKLKNYILFYEGVKPGTEKNKEIFDSALGVSLSPEIYENFSKIYGVSHQDNSLFLGIRNGLDYNVDLNIDEIVELYLKKIPEEEKSKLLDQGDETLNEILSRKQDDSENKEKVDITEELFQELSKLNDKELMVIQYINKSILNFIIKNEGLRNLIVEKLGKENIFEVILDDRNKYITDKIIETEHDKIFAMYGLMHFEGIYNYLKENDSRWEITETSYKYPVSYPNSFISEFLGW